MELYTLTNTFFPKEFIGQFTSLIWTERYSAAGDVQLVVPPIPSMIEALAPGTRLGLRGTKEIMMVETQSIKSGLLTVTGSSLVKFLNEREAWFMNPAYDGTDTSVSPTSDFTEITTVGQFLADVMNETVINPVAWGAPWNTINLDWGNEKIPGLALGRIDPTGSGQQLTFPIGPLYDGLAQVATAQVEGFKLYLESASYSTDTYVLRFATYRGKNRTSNQTANLMIRFSPALDSLTDVSEISSIADYKNTVYVYYKGQVSVHYIPTLPAAPAGFGRRTIMVNAPDIFLLPDHIPAFREQVARDALAHNVYVQAVDGRVSPNTDYKFGVDYYLGDVVELEGFSGLTSKARVTEYIRSQDQFGEQAYPTLTVIDPLGTNYIPDPEPDSSWEPDWLDDPNWSDDWTATDLGNPLKDPRITRHPFTINPRDPFNPNPDPVPFFPGDDTGGDGGGDGGDGTGSRHAPTSGIYAILGYYPDQNNGEAIGYLVFDGPLTTAWQYHPEDTGPDANTNWLELIPRAWTADHSHVIVRSEEDKDSTAEFPWRSGFVYWLMSLDGVDTRMTETITDTSRSNPDAFGFSNGWRPPGVMWCASTASWKWYVSSTSQSPPEYVYADGVYTTDSAALLHGESLGSGSPVELFVSNGGSSGKSTLSGLTRILSVDDFPPHMRWSDFRGPFPSPDGSKLVVSKTQMGPNPRWQLIGLGTGIGEPLRLTAGNFGSLFGSTTADIADNATAEEVYNAILLGCPILHDPRATGGTSIPYSGGPLPGSITLVFTAPELGAWMSVSSGSGNHILSRGAFEPRGDDVWFVCHSDGSALTEIDFGIEIDAFGGWSPDSTKLFAIVHSPAVGLGVPGDPYCRLLVYDVASGDISFPLDYSSHVVAGSGPLQDLPWFSPDNSKLLWIIRYSDGTASLRIAAADGTGDTEIYHQTVTSGSTDQSAIVLGHANNISWSFDSKKILIVDGRDPAPVWVFDTVSESLTKVWDGSGWDIHSEQKWIYDSLNFNGG